MSQQTSMTLPGRAVAMAGAAAVATAAVVLPPLAAPRLAATVDTLVVDVPVALAAAALPDGSDFDFDFATIDPAVLAAPAYDDAIVGVPDLSAIIAELTSQVADPAASVWLTFNPAEFLQGMWQLLWWPIQEIEHLINGVWGLL